MKVPSTIALLLAGLFFAMAPVDAAPGDWTVRLSRTETGALAGLTVGCWLARNVGFARVG